MKLTSSLSLFPIIFTLKPSSCSLGSLPSLPLCFPFLFYFLLFPPFVSFVCFFLCLLYSSPLLSLFSPFPPPHKKKKKLHLQITPIIPMQCFMEGRHSSKEVIKTFKTQSLTTTGQEKKRSFNVNK